MMYYCVDPHQPLPPAKDGGAESSTPRGHVGHLFLSVLMVVVGLVVAVFGVIGVILTEM